MIPHKVVERERDIFGIPLRCTAPSFQRRMVEGLVLSLLKFTKLPDNNSIIYSDQSESDLK